MSTKFWCMKHQDRSTGSRDVYFRISGQFWPEMAKIGASKTPRKFVALKFCMAAPNSTK